MLEIESQISAICGNVSIIITVSGKSVLVRCTHLDFNTFAERLFPLFLSSKEALKRLHVWLLAQEMSLVFELAGRTVLHVGHNSRPGLIAFLLGMYPFEIKTLPLCAVLIGSMRSGR